MCETKQVRNVEYIAPVIFIGSQMNIKIYTFLFKVSVPNKQARVNEIN